MGVVVIGGGGAGGGGNQQNRVEGGEIVDSSGQQVAVFPDSPEGRKNAIRYLKMLDRESGQTE